MPNSLAGGRRVGSHAPAPTGTITFAVPDLEEPYFAELTGLVVSEAAAHGLSVMIQQTAGIKDREIAVVNGQGIPRTDGLLHVPRSLTVADLTKRVSPGPLVLLGEHIASSPFAHVTIDNRAAAAAATEHLIARGRRRLLLVGPHEAIQSDAANQRYQGYKQQVATHPDLEISAGVVPALAFTQAEGWRCGQEIAAMSSRPDGIVCGNDSIALGLMAALQNAGLRIPEDVAVIGIDGITAGQYSSPSLSSVRPLKKLMVERAIAVLMRQMNASRYSDQPVEQITVEFELIERQSTSV